MSVDGTPLPTNGGETNDGFQPSCAVLGALGNGRIGALPAVAVDRSERPIWLESGRLALQGS